MKKMLYILLVPFIFLGTTGCTTLSKYRVTLDAITAPNITLQPTSFQIKALKKGVDESSLLFQQESGYLRSILVNKGYTESPTKENAQEIIYLAYGIAKVKEEHRTYTEPSMSMSMGFGSPFYHSFYGGGYYHHYHPMFFNSFGYTNYRSYSKTYNYYNRYVTLLSKNRQGRELWRVDVSSVGESQNLKKIIPMLIKATEPYIGTNTKEPVQLVLKEEKKR